MATSVEHAKQGIEMRNAKVTATTVVHVPAAIRAAIHQQANAGGAALPGINAQDFVAAHRIHIKDGSLFIDPYLAIHPRELDPANEAALREKLALTYSINNPSFFEGQDRAAIALNLGQMIPISTAAKHSRLLEEIKQFNAQVDSGTDAGLAAELQDKRAPFAAIVRDVTQHPEADPVGLEMLKNSLAIYLLVREKLTANGYLGKLPDYVQRTNTPDQVLADLGEKIGTTPLAVREAALKGGVDGVGKLLGLDPVYVANVKELVDHAAGQDFGYNLVEHWHLGRQLQGLKAPLAEKISVGMDARITAKIDEYRTRIRHHFDVPEPVKKEEHRIADALNLVEPIERALMYKLGYEICFSPEVTADDIAFYKGIYGLHRKAANDLRDARGTYRIYFSGRGDLKGSMRTLVHEVAHNLWPEQFTPAEVIKIDQLAASDQLRFGRFQVMMDTQYNEFEKLFNAYKAGNEQEKAAVIAAADQQFAIYDFHAEALFPYLREAHDFQFAVKHLSDTLTIEGARYNHSGYNSPEERFREVISRFAELKQVEYRGEPQFVQFLAPGLNQVWENHYLPHLTRVYQGLENGTIKPTHEAAAVAVPHREESETTVAQQPKIEEQPKVQQQPVAPTPTAVAAPKPAPVTATHGAEIDNDIDAPQSSVNRATVQVTDRVLPALNALKSMGVNV